ncbi:MAG: type 2 lantipeptide synthetase LanM [Deltaproteobacteria bacterium]|nr:type 2 lantipeptide synthetase LanM [Deltaproteobacteria bacterium]
MAPETVALEEGAAKAGASRETRATENETPEEPAEVSQVQEEDILDWNRLAARGATLDERWCAYLASPSYQEPPTADSPRRNLDSWARACAEGDQEAFDRRLSWDGWTKERLELCLAEETPFEAQEIPKSHWRGSLKAVFDRRLEVAEELATEGNVAEDRYFPRGRALPFLEILVPYLREARRQLETLTDSAPDCLAPAALQALEIRLLHDLVSLAVESLYERFGLFRQVLLRSQKSPRAATQGAPNREIYLAFVDGFLRQGWGDFFQRHATLARQLGRVMNTWVETTAELWSRLQGDGEELVKFFGPQGDPGSAAPRVEAIGTGLSDRHHGGRQVLSLRLEGGIRIIYKPRSMVLEGAYNGLLRWLQEAGLEPAPRPLKVLVREGYGWVETVDPVPLANREEARAYYRRAGALICLAYALRGDDLHGGNLVAAAQGPVVVDGETFFQPSRQSAHGDVWDGSALRNQLLTNSQRGADGGAFDHGGLQPGDGFMTESERPFWKETNTDSMSFELRDVTANRGANEAWMGEAPTRPEEYPEEILDGFSKTYGFLLQNRSRVLAPGGPLKAFQGGSTRILFRPSQIYGVLLARLAKPRYQRQAWTADFLIDSLNRAFLGSLERPTLWPLVARERQDLQGRDVPHFSLPSDSVDIPCRRGNGLELGQEVVEGEFLRSGFSAVRQHLEALSYDDLERQKGSIRRTLVPRELLASNLPGAGKDRTSTAKRGKSVGADELPTAQELTHQAAVVGEAFLAAAQAGDSSREEEGDGWLKRADRRDLPLSPDLYGGALGITFFLAALSQATQRDDFLELARRAGEQLFRCLPEHFLPGGKPIGRKEGRLGPGETWGLLSGLGGWLYVLPWVGDFLGEPEPWLARSERLAESIRRADLEAAVDFDLSDGLSGALVGLLALWERTGNSRYLTLAQACGTRLREAQQPAPNGSGAAWLDRRGRLSAGFGHGAAGVTFALARLYGATESAAEGNSIRDAIQQALAYERSLFSQRLGNWPVVGARRKDGRPLFMVAWCNGAAGIGLARLETWKALEDPQSRSEAQAALATVRRALPAATDHLCCGNLGRLELLFQAGLDGAGEGLQRAALLSLGGGLQRAQEEGGFRLDASPDSLYHPGLFRGLAGIGYSLLRFSDPSQFPSVLTFSPPAGRQQ